MQLINFVSFLTVACASVSAVVLPRDVTVTVTSVTTSVATKTLISTQTQTATATLIGTPTPSVGSEVVLQNFDQWDIVDWSPGFRNAGVFRQVADQEGNPRLGKNWYKVEFDYSISSQSTSYQNKRPLAVPDNSRLRFAVAARNTHSHVTCLVELLALNAATNQVEGQTRAGQKTVLSTSYQEAAIEFNHGVGDMTFTLTGGCFCANGRTGCPQGGFSFDDIRVTVVEYNQ